MPETTIGKLSRIISEPYVIFVENIPEQYGYLFSEHIFRNKTNGAFAKTRYLPNKHGLSKCAVRFVPEEFF